MLSVLQLNIMIPHPNYPIPHQNPFSPLTPFILPSNTPSWPHFELSLRLKGYYDYGQDSKRDLSCRFQTPSLTSPHTRFCAIYSSNGNLNISLKPQITQKMTEQRSCAIPFSHPHRFHHFLQVFSLDFFVHLLFPLSIWSARGNKRSQHHQILRSPQWHPFFNQSSNHHQINHDSWVTCIVGLFQRYYAISPFRHSIGP